MDLYLQLGHGMMGYCKELIAHWGEGTVILSPRDLTEEQTQKFSNEILKLNGNLLFDPQYYNPRANHHKLTEWSHWYDDFDTSLLSDSKYIEERLSAIRNINNYCSTSAYIIPSQLCENVDNFWIKSHEFLLKKSIELFNDKDKYITLALSKDVIMDEKSIEKLIDISSSWDIEGYYIVPEGNYLEDESEWLINLTLLVAGLKLQDKKIIVGYSNHQMLSLACANVDAIASGTFLNIRSFSTSKFNNPDKDSISRRTTWYYCPQAMSEYRIRALDRAYDYKILDLLMPFGKINIYTKILFSGTKPSSVGFKDSLSFKHYLLTLKQQCLLAKRDTFENTLNYHQKLADNAYEVIRQLENNGVRESNRSFKDIVDIYQDAIYKLNRERGALLKRKW